TGRFHIFCAEYCGTLHSGMIGWVEVMEPTDYQKWLAGGTEGSLASQGEKLFQKLACATCHTNDATGRGPVLLGLFGKTVTLSDDKTVVADENYIRESILNPQAKIVQGFGPIMPTFQGQVAFFGDLFLERVQGFQPIMPTFQEQVSEEGLLQLAEYVKAMKRQTALHANNRDPAPD